MYTPSFTVRRQLAAGTLQSVLGSYLPAVGSLQALWPTDSPKVKVFGDFMAKHLLAE